MSLDVPEGMVIMERICFMNLPNLETHKGAKNIVLKVNSQKLASQKKLKTSIKPCFQEVIKM